MSENAGLDVATGMLSAHQSDGSTGNVVHPIDASATPGVQAPTMIEADADARVQGGVFDQVADFAQIRDQGEADVRASQARGQDARNGMLADYQSQLLPLGSQPYQIPDMPSVPEDGSSSATDASSDFPWVAGDQPSKGLFVPNSGNEPV